MEAVRYRGPAQGRRDYRLPHPPEGTVEAVYQSVRTRHHLLQLIFSSCKHIQDEMAYEMASISEQLPALARLDGEAARSEYLKVLAQMNRLFTRVAQPAVRHMASRCKQIGLQQMRTHMADEVRRVEIDRKLTQIKTLEAKVNGAADTELHTVGVQALREINEIYRGLQA